MGELGKKVAFKALFNERLFYALLFHSRVEINNIMKEEEIYNHINFHSINIKETIKYYYFLVEELEQNNVLL